MAAALFGDSPELPPPFLNIPGISNFRDIGGYPISTTNSSGTNDPSGPSKSIKRNLIYRSADPSKVTPQGISQLRSLGIRKVFDLRSEPEIKRQGPEWEGVEIDSAEVFVTRGISGDGKEEVSGEVSGEGRIERVWCPVFEGERYGPEEVAERFAKYAERDSEEGFAKAYKDILLAAPNAYSKILHHLCSPTPSPCIIHCTAGKDRTGVLCALLYLLCSVSPDVIAKEYALTDTGLEHLKPLFRERLLRNEVFGGDVEAVERMIGAQEGKMRATVGMVEREFGGAEAYVRVVLGFGDEEVERLRANLMSDEAAVY